MRAAVAIAAGFSETGEAGKEAEAALARAAADAGVTLIGPNCMGLLATPRSSTPSASWSCSRTPAA